MVIHETVVKDAGTLISRVAEVLAVLIQVLIPEGKHAMPEFVTPTPKIVGVVGIEKSLIVLFLARTVVRVRAMSIPLASEINFARRCLSRPVAECRSQGVRSQGIV